MSDGGPKRSIAGAFRINVNPLVISCCYGKEIDSILGNFHPLAVTKVLAQTLVYVVWSVQSGDSHSAYSLTIS